MKLEAYYHLKLERSGISYLFSKTVIERWVRLCYNQDRHNLKYNLRWLFVEPFQLHRCFLQKPWLSKREASFLSHQHKLLFQWLPNHSLSTHSCSFSRSEEHTSELQSRPHLVCRLLLEKK